MPSSNRHPRVGRLWGRDAGSARIGLTVAVLACALIGTSIAGGAVSAGASRHTPARVVAARSHARQHDVTHVSTAAAFKPATRPIGSPVGVVGSKPVHRHRHALHPRTAGSVVGMYAGAADPTALNAAGTLIGHPIKYAMDFLDGSTWQSISDPTWFVSQWKGSGYTMIWGVPMLPNSGASLDVGATGAYDQYFRTLAQRFVTDGQGSSIIRLGWEFNGGWFPWAANGHAQAFVDYWRQIVDTMNSVKGANFSYEWNPTRGDMGVGSLDQYYPGDAYVTYVGLDVYDLQWGSYPGRKAEWQFMLTQPDGLDWLAKFGAEHDKALCFPEWGLGWDSDGEVSGGDNGYFVRQMAHWIATHNVANAVAWSYGSNPLPSASVEPDATRAFAKSFGG